MVNHGIGEQIVDRCPFPERLDCPIERVFAPGHSLILSQERNDVGSGNFCGRDGQPDEEFSEGFSKPPFSGGGESFGGFPIVNEPLEKVEIVNSVNRIRLVRLLRRQPLYPLSYRGTRGASRSWKPVHTGLQPSYERSERGVKAPS